MRLYSIPGKQDIDEVMASSNYNGSVSDADVTNLTQDTFKQSRKKQPPDITLAITEHNRKIDPEPVKADDREMDPDIAVLKYRADQADVRMVRVEDKIDRLTTAVARLPTTGSLWTMVATVIGLSVAVVAVVVTMQGNALSAFQAGLSSFQTHLATLPAK